MKPWREQLRLTHPIRGVRLVGTRSADEERARELRQIETAAFERGRQAGEAALSQQLLQQRQDVFALQQGVLDALEQCVPRLLREAEGVLVELALEAARKWMAGQPIDAPAIEACVREAMDQMEEATEFNILMNAEDLALLEQHGSDLVSRNATQTRTKVGVSPDVTRRGGVHCPNPLRHGRRPARDQGGVAPERPPVDDSFACHCRLSRAAWNSGCNKLGAPRSCRARVVWCS